MCEKREIMQKVFLSHSSVDKESYVRIVYKKLAKELGEENVIIDEISFQEGRKTIEEIDESLGTTDLFVVFFSNESLESDWVKHELFCAGELWNKSKLKQICPIIIDSSIKYDDSRIPDWMQENYNLQFVSRPTKAAQIIQQRMIELSFEKHPRLKERQEIFVGRNAQIGLFEERMDDFEREKPICVVASGINSVGRRTLLKKCITKSNIKKYSYPFPKINLNYDESIEDFILKLFDLGLTKTIDIYNLMTLELEEKLNIIIDMIVEIQDQEELILIEDNGSLIDHNGEMAKWFSDLLSNPKIKSKLTFCIVSKFRLQHFADDVSYNIREKIFWFGVEELTPKERRGLLSRYLQFEEIELELEDIRLLSDLLAGFPEQIFYAVTLLKEKGIDYVRRNTYQIVEYNNKKASIIIKDIEENDNKIALLALLSKFDYVSIKYIYDIVEQDNQYLKYIDEFIAKAICEYVGSMKEYIRVNDTIKDYVARNNYKIKENHQENIKNSVNSFLKNLSLGEYDMPEYLFSLKEALLNGKEIAPQYLVPSLYLKTMTDFYNRRKNKEVVMFADKALENERYMDSRIVFEIRYLLCSALAKQKDKRFNDEVRKLKGADFYFLYGFYYRQIGKFDKALEMINKSMDMKPNFSKAKREKVQIYIGMQEYQKARELAKENYQNYGDNPYHIQAYFTCLIKSEKSKENKEILESLIATLNTINSDTSKEMSLRCQAQLECFYNDSQEQAIACINEAIAMNPNIQYARIVKFDICEKFGMIEEMKAIVKFFKQPEYRTKYQNNVICFEATIMAFEGRVNAAVNYFMDNIRDFTDEAKDKFVIKLNRYIDTH